MRARCQLRAHSLGRLAFAGTAARAVHHFPTTPLPRVSAIARSVQLDRGFIAHCARALLIPFHSALPSTTSVMCVSVDSLLQGVICEILALGHLVRAML